MYIIKNVHVRFGNFPNFIYNSALHGLFSFDRAVNFSMSVVMLSNAPIEINIFTFHVSIVNVSTPSAIENAHY